MDPLGVMAYMYVRRATAAQFREPPRRSPRKAQVAAARHRAPRQRKAHVFRRLAEAVLG